jgi:UPF0176 protein
VCRLNTAHPRVIHGHRARTFAATTDLAPSGQASLGDMTSFKVVLFYKYTQLDSKTETGVQEALARKHGCTGRILVANEGLNGTLSAPLQRNEGDGSTFSTLDLYIDEMKRDERFATIDWKTSTATLEPFPDLVVKDCKEIISTGMYHIPPPDPVKFPCGKHLKPAEFHEELKKAQNSTDYIVLDVRNHQEHAIGHFKGATDPVTRNFAEWPKYATQHIDEFRGKKVLMYCTGGIRCEKASAFLKSKGCEDVSQLSGGIHRYLETYQDGGYFRGKNFVFDKRVTQTATTAPSNEEDVVTGECYECSAPWDQIDGGSVCTVCRDHVLVCRSCRVACRGIYYCHNHLHLKSLYFYFIDHFSEEELLLQREGLLKLHQVLLKAPPQESPNSMSTTMIASHITERRISTDAGDEKDCHGDKEERPKKRKKCINKEKRKMSSRRYRNKRKTLSRQIQKIDTRLEGLRSGTFQVEPYVHRCRTCMKSTSECIDGACWGFWKEEVQTGTA